MEKKKIRQIIIETDGDDMHIVKAEVSGKIEFIGILRGVIDFLTMPPQKDSSEKQDNK